MAADKAESISLEQLAALEEQLAIAQSNLAHGRDAVALLQLRYVLEEMAKLQGRDKSSAIKARAEGIRWRMRLEKRFHEAYANLRSVSQNLAWAKRDGTLVAKAESIAQQAEEAYAFSEKVAAELAEANDAYVRNLGDTTTFE